MDAFTKALLKSAAAMFLIIAVIGGSLGAESLERNTLYVIEGQHEDEIHLHVFPISNTPEYLYASKIKNIAGHGLGAVGMAVHNGQNKVFLSYENNNAINAFDADTMTFYNSLTLTGTSNLAGIVVSEERDRLYAVDRGNTHVYVFRCDCTRMESEEFDLESGAWGIDVSGNKLYATFYDGVTDGSGNYKVGVYDLDSGVETSDTFYADDPRMAIAVDDSDEENTMVYLTTTRPMYNFPWVTTISQYNVDKGIEKKIDIRREVEGVLQDRDGRGISINPAKGLVYVAIGSGPNSAHNYIRVYGENQFEENPAAPIEPLKEIDLGGAGHSPTDVLAISTDFGAKVTKNVDISQNPDSTVTAGEIAYFIITIENPNTEPLMLTSLEDNFDYEYLEFHNSNAPFTFAQTNDKLDFNGSYTIAPDSNLTFKISFKTKDVEHNITTENHFVLKKGALKEWTIGPIENKAQITILPRAVSNAKVTKTVVSHATNKVKLGEEVIFQISLENSDDREMNIISMQDNYNPDTLEYINIEGIQEPDNSVDGVLLWDNPTPQINIPGLSRLDFNITFLTKEANCTQNEFNLTEAVIGGQNVEPTSDKVLLNIMNPTTNVTKEITEPVGTITEEDNVAFRVTIENPNDTDMILNDFEDTFSTKMEFISASITPNVTEDGKLSWTNQNIIISPNDTYEFTVVLKAEEGTILGELLYNLFTVLRAEADGISIEPKAGMVTFAVMYLQPKNPVVEKSVANAGDIKVDDEIVFDIVIENPNEGDMTVLGFKDVYDTNYLEFISSSLAPDDSTDDGELDWANPGITIAGGDSYHFTLTYKAKAFTTTSDLADNTFVVTDTVVEPSGYDTEEVNSTVEFAIKTNACVPQSKNRGSGPVLNSIGIILLAGFMLIFTIFYFRKESLTTK